MRTRITKNFSQYWIEVCAVGENRFTWRVVERISKLTSPDDYYLLEEFFPKLKQIHDEGTRILYLDLEGLQKLEEFNEVRML